MVFAGRTAMIAAGLYGIPPQAASTKARLVVQSDRAHPDPHDHQILFYEVNGKIWLSNLTVPCSTLTNTDTIVWESFDSQTVREVEQVRVAKPARGCLLGPLVGMFQARPGGESRLRGATSSREIRPR